MTREEAHKECLSRNCHCVKGEDRDCNYHTTIDEIFDDILWIKQKYLAFGYILGAVLTFMVMYFGD